MYKISIKSKIHYGSHVGEKTLSEMKIQWGIFQRDVFSPLLFVIAMMSLNYILRKCTEGYKLTKLQEKINHFLYIDNIRLFTKYEKGKESLIQIIMSCGLSLRGEK